MANASVGAADEILVIAAILGDLAAFDELVLRYRSAVVRTARAIVSTDDVEDVAQEALLLAFKALPSLEEPNKFPAWLNAITRRCAIRFSQQVQRQNKRNVALDEVLLEQVPALSRSMPENGADEELRNALRKIPDDYALAIQLHFMDDMPLQRIAGYLGVSLAVVKWRIHRGKSLLREQFRLLTERRKLWKRKMNYRA